MSERPQPSAAVSGARPAPCTPPIVQGVPSSGKGSAVLREFSSPHHQQRGHRCHKGSTEPPAAPCPRPNTAQGLVAMLPLTPPAGTQPAPAHSKAVPWHTEGMRSFYLTVQLRKFSHEAGMKTCVYSKSKCSIQHGHFFPQG